MQPFHTLHPALMWEGETFMGSQLLSEQQFGELLYDLAVSMHAHGLPAA